MVTRAKAQVGATQLCKSDGLPGAGGCGKPIKRRNLIAELAYPAATGHHDRSSLGERQLLGPNGGARELGCRRIQVGL